MIEVAGVPGVEGAHVHGPGLALFLQGLAMAIPRMFTVRHMRGCTLGPMGSAKGGIQIRAGKGAV